MLSKLNNRDQTASIGVVYLAWHALGPDCFKRFVETYRRHPAGQAHDLIVIYAGFDQQQTLNDAASVFADTPHIAIEIPEIRQDIAYYLQTARRVQHRYLCFLNTYTELITDNWLVNLCRHAMRDGVGLVGTTASYESLYDSVGLYQKIHWLCAQSGNRVSKAAAHYYDFYLKQICPSIIVEPPVQLPPRGLQRWRAQAVQLMKQREQDIAFRQHWDALTRPDMALADFGRFPAFPNPHVRSNGFMLRRAHLDRFDPSQIQKKLDACAFESGANSLTAQLRREGLAAIVATSDGQGYDVPDWARSDTFRLGDQVRLVLTDNRSREFLTMVPEERAVHVRITWGDYLKHGAPADIPGFGFAFARGSLSPRRGEPKPKPLSLESDPTYIACQYALQAMRVVEPALSPAQLRPKLVRRARSTARRAIRAALPPFRRLDDRAGVYSDTIAHLEAEVAGLRERIRALEVEQAKLQ